jgi:hypothetical protein
MLRRALILCVSLWLMVASGLAGHASPCASQPIGAGSAFEAPANAQAHCDRMGDRMATQPAPAEAPGPQTPETAAPFCCCPAVMAGLPPQAAPGVIGQMFRLPASFPLEARAPSRTLIPEPPPPKHLV